jgi:DinB family protein
VSSAVDLLAEQMSESYQIVATRLDGLTDGEFFWEPGPDCWRIYQAEDGRWTYDYEEPDPVPAPLTTIGWRQVHIAVCKVMYHEYAFGPRLLSWDSIETPHTADDATRMLAGGHELLADDLSKLSEADLETPVLTNWGEEWPIRRIFWTMIHHDAHHGAEIGVLRDLHRTIGPGAGRG